eukprot:4147689-Amphidinium_carterae.1
MLCFPENWSGVLTCVSAAEVRHRALQDLTTSLHFEDKRSPVKQHDTRHRRYTTDKSAPLQG